MKYLLFVLVLLPFLSCVAQQNEIDQITVTELSKLTQNADPEGMILDVRTRKEFQQGHIQDSKNIDVLQESSFVESINELDKTKTYYVICRSGGRSMKASQLMIENGFENVINVQGGMTAWNKMQR